jgi:hypothetical protein
MKTASVLVGLVLLAAGCSKATPLERVPDAELDANAKTSAETLGTRILSEWAKDEYKELSETEARPDFRKAHNDVDGQRTADKSIESTLGNFKSMTFQHAMRSKDKKMFVYRFKGSFDKAPDLAEVRVVFNDEGKLSGFWVKPWKDQI